MRNPKIRFSQPSGVPFEDWRLAKIKDLCFITKESINPKTNPDKTFVEYSMPAFDNCRIPYLRKGKELESLRLAINGDVILFNKLNIKKMRIWNVKNATANSLCSSEFLPLTVKEGFCQDFAFYYLSTKRFTSKLNGKSSGTSNSQKRIRPEDLLNEEIIFPCLMEQQKIVSFFSTLDQKIELNERKLEALEKLKKGVMQKIFTQEIRFKDKNGNQFPNWFSKKLLYVAPLQRGFDLPNSNLVPGSFPVVYSNGINFSHNSYKCEGEAVITGRSGTIGRVTYLPNCKYWPHNTTLWVTNFFNNIPKFIYYLYQYIDLNRFSTGTGVPTLNRNIIHDFVVTIPIRDEQLKISQFLTTIDTKINTAKLCLERLQELKKGFMQQMFV